MADAVGLPPALTASPHFHCKMMGSKFSKNAILMGSVDCYCLACDNYLKTEEDAIGHIEKPIHKKNLNAALYIDMYPDENIRKVKKGYYCEFCNQLFPTAAKVRLHVDEKIHNHKKGTNLLKRVGKSVVAFQNVIITDKAWHGIIGDTCVICNSEFEDEEIHKTAQMHLLSLVQSKLEFGAENTIYRMIDDGSYQCLTCNTVLSPSTLPTHFDIPEHKALYKKSRDEKSTPKPDKTPEVNENVKTLEKERANEKKAIPMPNVKKSITEPAKKPTGKAPKPVQNVDPDIRFCELLDAKDYIMNDKGKLWCIICEWTMDNVAVGTHLVSQHHQTMLKLHKIRYNKKNVAAKNEAIQVMQPAQPIEPALPIQPAQPIKTAQAIEPAQPIQPSPSVRSIQPIQPFEYDDADREKILDSVSRYQNNDIKINFVSSTAYCKKCSKDIDFISAIIDGHIEEHRKKTKKESQKVSFSAGTESNQNNTEKHTLFTKPVFIKKNADKDSASRPNSNTTLIDAEAETFAKQNSIAINRSDNKGHCKLCDTKVPISLKSMKEHVGGGSHKAKLTKLSEGVAKKKPYVLTKEPTADFIGHLTTIENIYIKDIVVNYKFVVSIYSFFFISKQKNGYKCETCNVSVLDGQIDQHKGTTKHEEAMQSIPVITSVDSEFVREPRPGVYHCGYCNTVEEQWADMVEHFLSAAHRESRVAAEWRLREYLPDIGHQQRRRDVERLLILRMLMRRNLF